MKALIIISCLGFLALLAEILNFKKHLYTLTLLGLTIALGASFTEWNSAMPSYLNHMVLFDNYSVAFIGVLIITAILWFLMAPSFFKDDTHTADKSALVLFALVGAICMVSYHNMTMLFIGIEILSICMYVLAGSNKKDLASNESAMKYFLMGAFATGFLLMGIAFIYGATASFDIFQIKLYLQNNPAASPLFYTGIILMLIGLAFKISAAPFHFWAPDVYDGAPIQVTSFMATIVKTAAIAAFFKLFSTSFAAASDTWSTTLMWLTAITILVGNITAVFQNDIKRMLAYSGVSHAGYLMLAILAMNELGAHSLVYYTLAYSIATIAAFAVVLAVINAKGNSHFDSFLGLAKNNRLLAVASTVSMLSLAGIPPLAGFFGKYYVFTAYLQNHSPILVLIALSGSAISIYYYFRLIVNMFKFESEEKIALSYSTKVLLVASVILTILLGLMPDLILGIW